ncbi:hypothetical protein J6590_037764 [Homalodisca vitripennis]|nr:hypothetical protein J6590_037764 [Homalodisca vitripennis]
MANNGLKMSCEYLLGILVSISRPGLSTRLEGRRPDETGNGGIAGRRRGDGACTRHSRGLVLIKSNAHSWVSTTWGKVVLGLRDGAATPAYPDRGGLPPPLPSTYHP